MLVFDHREERMRGVDQKNKIKLVLGTPWSKDDKSFSTIFFSFSCSHGIGPEGLFCLVSSLYDQIEHEKCVDIFQAAKLCCIQRPKLIENEVRKTKCPFGETYLRIFTTIIETRTSITFENRHSSSIF